MPASSLDKKLFFVVLGGRTSSSHIELHDVRWVIGEGIQDTFPQLRKEWFGLAKGLHIDSYLEIRFVDGYQVLIEKTKFIRSTSSSKTCFQEGSSGHKLLWFVNLGGYAPNHMNEIHEFGLVVAKTAKQASDLAKNRYLKDVLHKHKYDISLVSSFKLIDNCNTISNLGDWKVTLIPDPKLRSQPLRPDWYGYLRIDDQFQKEIVF